MSSRALRRAQREREEQEQLRKLQQEEEEEEDDENNDDVQPAPSAQKSLFAMLDQADDASDEVEEDEDPAEAHAPVQESDQETDPTPAPKTSSKRKKKKKRKTKAKAADTKDSHSHSDMDEIDQALKSLSTASAGGNGLDTLANPADSATNELCQLLSVDSQSLHAANEMRRLFGRAALESDDTDDAAGAAGGRRRNRGARQQGLAAALRGRQGQGGRNSGLAALSLRRNLFIQGKEEWPLATSGGLGMEIVEKRADGTVEYKYIHNRVYQDVQIQFETCVASMDPNRLVQLLQYNPYHISTLLQVSEIAKQERDHATSGDLLERALFSFGRAVHSTFASNVSQGKARLDFRRPENREFWLAACRYISNLGMRATWRTVFEWAKLLLSLDPEGDPYCMGLVIDQYALRGRQPQAFLDLSNTTFLTTRWKTLPNIQLSRALALVQIGETGKGKQALYTAVSRFPWVVARLYQELNLEHPPPGIWAKVPRTDSEKLHCELYATRAKDLWNTPEASGLLVEVSSALSDAVPEPAIVEKEISVDEARHVLMSDTPALIAHLPRAMTSRITSVSDPLPPSDNLPSYTPTSQIRETSHQGSQQTSTADNLREMQGLYQFFRDLFPWFEQAATGGGGGGDEARQPPTEEEIERRIMEAGVSEEVIAQRTQRLMELQAEFQNARQSLLDGVEDEDEDGETAEHAPLQARVESDDEEGHL